MPPSTEQQKEVARQEQFWFTATTLGFVGLVGSVLKTTSVLLLVIAIAMIGVLSVFSIYLVVTRHRRYRDLNEEIVRSWWHALRLSWEEKSGTLYCVAVVTCASIGSILILIARFASPC